MDPRTVAAVIVGTAVQVGDTGSASESPKPSVPDWSLNQKVTSACYDRDLVATLSCLCRSKAILLLQGIIIVLEPRRGGRG